ncbi:universal stress protein [Microbispora rosea]|uniref:universal stress protein n=1 Tax=Microbispora rosea TaxID=58117 RepID=UPI00343D8D0F
MPIWLIIIAIWVLIGLLTALWMARRGHRDPAWIVSAIVLGPAMAVIARELVERRPKLLAREDTGPVPSGGVRVLVGTDGSTESQQALHTAVTLLGPCAERVVVAEVIDYDSMDSDRCRQLELLGTRLDAELGTARTSTVACAILAGPPAEALIRFAQEQAIDVVVVGKHGRGMSKRLLGNVTRELVRDSPVPVLVAGGPSGDHDR